MQPNKKPKGFFMHPGATGFKFKAGSYKENTKLTSVLSVLPLFALLVLCAIGFFNPSGLSGLLGCVGGTGISMATVMLVGKIEGKESSTHNVDGTEKTAEQTLMYKFKFESNEAIVAALKTFTETDEQYKAIKSIQDSLAKLKPHDEATATKLRTDLDALGVIVKALKEDPKKDKQFKEGSIAATLLANKEKIDKFISSKTGKMEIEHKATMTSSDITGRDNYFTWHEGGRVGQIPVRRPFMRELFKTVPTTTEYIKYIDQETVTRDAKNVALCGVTTSNTKLTWKTYDLKVDKVRDFTNICLDMMNDYAFVQGEIERLLDSSLQLKIDNDLLLGTGVSPILHGLDEIASTFDAAATGASYSGTVVEPNLIDLISIAGAQIKAFGSQNMWFPNYVLINPREVQKLKALKDRNNNYIKNNMLFSSLFQDASGKYYIDGMLLVENPLVPENEFYIGDFTKGTVYARPGVGIEFAYENGDNFETETVTVKVYERLNLLVRNVDANAFMHCDDIAAGLTAITKTVTP